MQEVDVPEDLRFLQPIVDTSLARIGNTFDGGYVVSRELLSRTTKLISLGYGWNSNFEKNVTRLNPGIKIYIYDDVASLRNCIKPWIKFPRFFFGSMIRGKIVQPVNFFWYLPSMDFIKLFFSIRNKLSYRKVKIVKTPLNKNETSLKSILTKLGPGENLFIKIDIEGAEYEIIDQIVNSESNILGVAIEFHHISNRKDDFISAVKNLQTKFYINHLHPNNHRDLKNEFPDVIEISFVSKQEFTAVPQYRNASHLALDYPNNPQRLDINLIFRDLKKSNKL